MTKCALTLLALLAVVSDVPSVAAQATAPVSNGGEVLFTMPITGQQQSISVIRGPSRDPVVLKGIMNDGWLAQIATVYDIRVELQARGQGPLILASRLRLESRIGGGADRGDIVLDARIEDGLLLLAMTKGADLYLWQVGVGLPTYGPYQLNRWQTAALADRLDADKVSVKLGRTDDHRWTADVVDRRGGMPPYANSRFEQVDPNSWDFKQTRVRER